MKLDAVHKALTEQTSRIDTLASWKDTWSKRTVATATKATRLPEVDSLPQKVVKTTGH